MNPQNYLNARPDLYEQYEEMFNPTQADRQARRKRKPRVDPHTRKKPEEQVVETLADETAGLEGGFQTTYQPGRYEEGWLLDSLRPFYDQELISDVVATVKGGKEASVYRCVATPSTGATWLAAKVYRPRIFRNLRNDKLYREGRDTLTFEGRVLKKTDHRALRALNKKTAFGEQIAHTSWLMHEFKSLELLYAEGADVPRPVAVSENAILMSYHGDEQMPAPTLNGISLPREEAQQLYEQVLANVELMLRHGFIHGDLSAYNILYWQGVITLIDFPQVTNLYTPAGALNSNARAILERDIVRVCEYFSRQGVPANAGHTLSRLWRQYARGDEDDILADFSRWQPDEAEGDDDAPAGETTSSR